MAQGSRRTSRKGLTPLETRMLEKYCDPKSPTYRNGTQSVLAVSKAKDAHVAGVLASQMIAKPQVQKALREYLDTPNYKSLIHKRLEEMLSNPDIRPRDLISAMDYWAKISGGYAPEKVQNINLNVDDRDTKYAEILAKVRKEQATVESTVTTAPTIEPVIGSIVVPTQPAEAIVPEDTTYEETQEAEDDDEEEFIEIPGQEVDDD